MAVGTEKERRTREPQFGLTASLADLRLSRRIALPPAMMSATDDDEAPKKPSPKRKARDPDEDASRERKPRPSKASRNRRTKTPPRVGLYRLFYWARARPVGRYRGGWCRDLGRRAPASDPGA